MADGGDYVGSCIGEESSSSSSGAFGEVPTGGANGKVSYPSKRICLLLLRMKKTGSPFGFIPIHYIPIVGFT